MEEMTEDDWEAWYESNEAEDEGLVTDQASALKFRKAMVERLKERAERKFYKALERGEIRL